MMHLQRCCALPQTARCYSKMHNSCCRSVTRWWCGPSPAASAHCPVQPDDQGMMAKAAALLQERDKVIVPRKPSRHCTKPTATLHILRTLEFSSQTLRSGVVAHASDGLPGVARLFIRGAPAVIADLVQPSSLPADFDQVLCFNGQQHWRPPTCWLACSSGRPSRLC